jgi:hypothetical protein
MLEKTIVKRIMAFLKTLDECFCWKEHGSMYGTAGIPDIICCYKGKFVAFEVKTETGKLSALQAVTLSKIKVAGGVAIEVRSLDEVKRIIEKVDNGGDYDS